MSDITSALPRVSHLTKENTLSKRQLMVALLSGGNGAHVELLFPSVMLAGHSLLHTSLLPVVPDPEICDILRANTVGFIL